MTDNERWAKEFDDKISANHNANIDSVTAHFEILLGLIDLHKLETVSQVKGLINSQIEMINGCKDE